MSTDFIKIIAIIVSILIAIVGYFVTYFNNLRLARRAERLSLLNQQINELYGPLYVVTQTSGVLANALQEKMRIKGSVNIDDDAPKDDSDLSEWRLWVENVFIPYNQILQDIILNNAHLIREQEYPRCLKLFCAHEASLRVVVEKWKKSDFSEKTSMLNFPTEVNRYAEQSFKELKKEQLSLIKN